ncbi:endoglucanase [Elysia marginata]|uniref:Endoglucanase n=1 Tax=Elysia marginata TaxID=1093978 RepID=A0AAV4F4C7_9GAST|nr:endoglucanase [Elysia marginata]
MPARSKINCAMQEITDAHNSSSEQHKESTDIRQSHDNKDTEAILKFLISTDPFSTDTFLRSIAIGVTFDGSVNLENAEKVGNQILKGMVCKSVQDYSFRRTDQVTTKDTAKSKS